MTVMYEEEEGEIQKENSFNTVVTVSFTTSTLHVFVIAAQQV